MRIGLMVAAVLLMTSVALAGIPEGKAKGEATKSRIKVANVTGGFGTRIGVGLVKVSVVGKGKDAKAVVVVAFANRTRKDVASFGGAFELLSSGPGKVPGQVKNYTLGSGLPAGTVVEQTFVFEIPTDAEETAWRKVDTIQGFVASNIVYKDGSKE